MSGFFQDMRYLSYSDLKDLTLRKPSLRHNSFRALFDKHSVIGVHVRRGDFLGQLDSHGCLASEWYLTQIYRSLEIVGLDAKVIIFTDDREWVFNEITSDLPESCSVNVISKEDLEDPAESWDLLRSADLIICSNSTFSITAAFYSGSRVVSPFPLTRSVNFEGIAATLPESWSLAEAIWESP